MGSVLQGSHSAWSGREHRVFTERMNEFSMCSFYVTSAVSGTGVPTIS